MSKQRQVQDNQKALMLLTAARWERKGNYHVPVESSVLFHQREAIIRKSEELGIDIVEEFVIPKQSELLTNPMFRTMLRVILDRGIDYVLIYPARPHRIRQRSAVITAAINRAGARIISASQAAGIDDAAEFILYMVNDFDRFTRRRDAQLRQQRERTKRAPDAA
jgi:hypothetical protein